MTEALVVPPPPAAPTGPPSLTPAKRPKRVKPRKPTCPYEAAERAEPIVRPTGVALAVAKAMCVTWGHKVVEETYIDSHGGLDGIERCARCGTYDV